MQEWKTLQFNLIGNTQMHIEDIIETSLRVGVKFNSWEQKLMESLMNQLPTPGIFISLFPGSPLTEKQAKISIKILKRHLPQLSQLTGTDFTPALENPTYRHGIRTINYNKKIAIVKNDFDQKVIRVEFPFDESLLEKIRKGRSRFNLAHWDRDKKAWFFSLDETSIQFLMPFVDDHEFFCDEEFENYAQQIKKIQQESDIHIPMLVKKEGRYELANVSKYVPQISSTDLIGSLFEARKLGILVWDDTIEKELESSGTDPLVITLLKNQPENKISINKEDYNLESLKQIIKHLTPCLFVIPGGSEFEKVRHSLELLNSIGIENSNISVLFRLPNETDAEFNKFVKDNSLNSPLSESTQAVMVSGKIPKTIIESKISFNSLVNYGFYNVHYTIRDYVISHPNVIHITASNQKDLGFL